MNHPVETYVRAMIDLYEQGVATSNLMILFPWDQRAIRRIVNGCAKRPKIVRPRGVKYHLSQELLVETLKRHGLTLMDLCEFTNVPTALEMRPILHRLRKRRRPRRDERSRRGLR